MSTFIVRIELHPSDPDQAISAVHAAMERAGFARNALYLVRPDGYIASASLNLSK